MERKSAERECQLMVMQFGNFIFPERTDSIKLRSLITAAFPELTNIAYLDLDGEFQAANLTASELIGDNRDHHWNAHGHRKTAEILYRFLQENQLLTSD